MATKRKAWKLEYAILERKHKKLEEDYNLLKTNTSHIDDEGKAIVKDAEPVSEPLIKKEVVETPKEAEATLNNQPKEEPKVTSPQPLEVKGTNEQKPEEAQMEAQQEKLHANNDNSVDRNKCGKCGAFVDTTLICKCGEDYN